MMESYSSSGWVIHIHAGVWKVWANYQTFWAIFITLVLLPQSSVNLLEIYQTLSCMTGCFHTTVYMYSRMSPLYTCTVECHHYIHVQQLYEQLQLYTVLNDSASWTAEATCTCVHSLNSKMIYTHIPQLLKS